MTKYIIMVFAGACSFGMLSTFVKLAYSEGHGAAEISFSQALIGMVVLWIIVFISVKERNERNNRSSLWPVLLTGVAIGLTTFVYYLSVQYISASVAVVILMQFVWMGILMNWLFLKQRPALIQLIAMVMILGGTVLASGIVNERRLEISISGVLYALASALLYAVYIVANGSVGNNLHPLKKSALIMTGSAMGIFFVNAHHLISVNPFDFSLLKWSLFLSVFGTIIPPVLFAKGIPKIGAGISSLIMTVELPVAIVFAHVILDERIDFFQWVGVAVMLLAMMILNLQKTVWSRK